MNSSPTIDAFPDLWRRLQALKDRDRIAHAYLITGDDEDMLIKVARRWAAMIACQHPADSASEGDGSKNGGTAPGNPCGSCPACLSFATGAYREWYELRPQSKSRQILVGEMRDFEHQLSLTPAPGFRKIGVIIEADRLNDQAQNAFLKTLEEPPGNLVLLLLTTHPERLLATIRSRCQMLSFRANRRTFDLLASVDILPIFQKIKRNAGASVALEAATGLKTVFGSLMARAEDHEPEMPQQLAAMADQDAALKKRLLDQRGARIQAEYVRLRTQICGIIETWFEQRCICLSQAPPQNLPNPEIAPSREDLADVSLFEAQQDVIQAMQLSRFLAGNLDQTLAIEAFCLTVCQKTAPGRPNRPSRQIVS